MTDAAARRAHWDAVYGTRAEGEVSWFQADVGAVLARIARHAGRQAAVIDIGAGRSRLIDALLDAGFRDVTALDVSETALAEDAARLGPRGEAVHWIRADVTEWEPPRTYDLWHDRAALHFLTAPGDRAAYRRALFAGTRPGSVAILSGFAPDGPERCSGLPVQRCGTAEMEAFLGAAWRTLDSGGETHVTPGGVEQRFIVHVAARRGS